MANHFLFLTLKVFAATGGIEKVCRVAGKAMYETTITHGTSVEIFCMYDKPSDADDNKYFPTEIFKGFGTNKVKFIYAALRKGIKCDVVILSHINLLLVGWLIKKISPATKIILFAHGIEIWGPVNRRKKIMLHCCDEIISVSNFTRAKIRERHHIPENKCRVLNNCLDPFLPIGKDISANKDLRNRYGLKNEDQVLFTLTRLSSKERYKGYDKVLQAIVSLKEKYPRIHYLVGGSYDKNEKIYLDNMINRLSLNEQVTIAGFIPDEDLVAYFSMADIYVMPSMKEGFGIVFIEAMYYGLPVIAGNKDGSVDALCNGELGLLVDPLDVTAIQEAVEKILLDKNAYIPNRELLMNQFSYDSYKVKLENILL